MQTILNDIELDVAELKCLIQALSVGHDPKLAVVAGRNICRMKQRLDELQQALGQPEAPARAPEPSPALAEEKETPCPRQDDALSATSEILAPEAGSNAILGERIRPARDLRHALSLNDTFRFARELFEGDASRLNRFLTQLGDASTLDKALKLLRDETQAAEDNTALTDFEELLKKYFDQ